MKMINKAAAYNALKHEAETHGLSFSAKAYDRAARIIDQMPSIDPEQLRWGCIDESKVRECIKMLGAMQDSLVPCNYVGNDSALLDNITIESADFVLTTAIKILKGGII